MPATLKTLSQIIQDQQAVVAANSTLTDFNRGSLIRTMIEASSLQDADQYIQLAILQELFSILTATGSDLDARAQDYNLTRVQPSQSIGNAQVGDSTITTKITSTLGAAYTAGNLSVTLVSSTAFPSSGYIILDRDGPGTRERLQYSANNTGTGVLTLVSGGSFNHLLGASVILSQQGSDHPIPIGTQIFVPATQTSLEIDFVTTATATLEDGDVSVLVPAQSVATGAITSIGAGLITAFTSLPWPTATVTNPAPFTLGFDLESDAHFRQRIMVTIQTLTRATLLALSNATLGVSLATGQQVVSAEVLEDQTDQQVIVYIDNGSGTALSTATVSTPEIVIQNAASGKKRGRLANWPVELNTLNLFASTVQGTSTIVTPGVGSAVITDPLASFTSGVIGQTFLDPDGNFYVITAETTTTVTVTVSAGQANPVIGPYAIFNPAGSPLSTPSQYLFNETTGDIELVTGLNQYGALVAYPVSGSSYVYYTGLIQAVQQILNGIPSNLTGFPGVKAMGVKVKVLTPTIVTISVEVIIFLQAGSTFAVVQPLVENAILTYINGLTVGQEVIVNELIAAIMAVTGVEDLSLLLPTTNVLIGDGQLARTTLGNIDVT